MAFELITTPRLCGPGRSGISLLLIPRDTPGLTQAPLAKSGWWTSDTAIVNFDSCRVPATNLMGEENEGFRAIMHNFNLERLGIAASVLGMTRCAYEETRRYTAERSAYGQSLREHQVVRHKLVDMTITIQAMESMLDTVLWKVRNGDAAVADIARLKAYVGPSARAGRVRCGTAPRCCRHCSW